MTSIGAEMFGAPPAERKSVAKNHNRIGADI